jgi:hypothetical protein
LIYQKHIFLVDKMLGYKIAKSFGKRVVITLEIPEDAITNVKRTNIVHAETAK